LRNLAAGATSGMLGAFVGSPFQMVKIRLQTQCNRTLSATAGGSASADVVGHQHRYRHMLHGIYVVASQEGVLGLMRGVEAAMLRVGVGSAFQLSTYDTVKVHLLRRNLIRDNAPGHFASSLVAGFMVTIAMNPFDVISTRMYNQSKKSALYTNPFNCFIKIVRTEGFPGLYKGFLPHYLRLGPHTILTFMFWEQLKHRLNRKNDSKLL